MTARTPQRGPRTDEELARSFVDEMIRAGLTARGLGAR